MKSTARTTGLPHQVADLRKHRHLRPKAWGAGDRGPDVDYDAFFKQYHSSKP